MKTTFNFKHMKYIEWFTELKQPLPMQSTLATFFKSFMTSAHLIDCPALIKKGYLHTLSPSCSLKINLQNRTKYLPPLPILGTGGDILYFRRRGHYNLRAIITPFSPIHGRKVTHIFSVLMAICLITKNVWVFFFIHFREYKPQN